MSTETARESRHSAIDAAINNHLNTAVNSLEHQRRGAKVAGDPAVVINWFNRLVCLFKGHVELDVHDD